MAGVESIDVSVVRVCSLSLVAMFLLSVGVIVVVRPVGRRPHEWFLWVGMVVLWCAQTVVLVMLIGEILLKGVRLPGGPAEGLGQLAVTMVAAPVISAVLVAVILLLAYWKSIKATFRLWCGR